MKWLCIEGSFLNSHYPLYMWLLIIFEISGFLLLFRWGFNRYKESYQTKWFMPELFNYSESPSWEDVKLIISEEPLNHAPIFRRKSIGLIIFDLSKFFIPILILILAWDITLKIANEACLSCVEQGSNNQTFIIYIIGAFTLATGLFVAFIKLQAKIKSENRQIWVNNARKLSAEVIANILDIGYSEESVKRQRIKVYPSMIELELLLNPSEKDHRALSYLLRIAYGIKDLKIDKKLRECDELKCLKNLDPVHCKNDRDKLITYTIRLSSAIFKREWERIKRGK